MSRCTAARPTDEFHGWKCDITDGECMFLMPDSKRCAEMYGEGPDAYLLEDEENNKDNESNNSRIIEDIIADEEGDYLSDEDEFDDIIEEDYEED